MVRTLGGGGGGEESELSVLCWNVEGLTLAEKKLVQTLYL